MNGDGRLDIVSGCYSSRGGSEMVAPVWVLYRKEDGGFEAPVALKRADDKHILASDGDFLKQTTDRICTEPFAFDHDGDGDLDLIIGNFSGDFLLAINEGSRTEADFKSKPVLMKTADGQPLKLQQGNHGAPMLVDWDGDGDLDLLSGSGHGGVQIAINTPTEASKHVFSQFKPLIEDKPTYGIVSADEPVRIGGSWRIWVADYNADGKLDVLVGDRQIRSVAKAGLTVEEAKAKEAAWRTTFQEISNKARLLNTKYRAHLANPPKPETDADADADGEDEPGAEPAAEPEEQATPTPMEVWEQKRDALMAEVRQLNKERGAHYQKRAEFIDPVSTGHVWVYLQK